MTTSLLLLLFLFLILNQRIVFLFVHHSWQIPDHQSSSSSSSLAFALAFSAASKISSRPSFDISAKEACIADTVRAAVRGASGISNSGAYTCVSSTITSSTVSSTSSLISDIVFSFRDYSLERKCSKPADCCSSEKQTLDSFTSVSPFSIVAM